MFLYYVSELLFVFFVHSAIEFAFSMDSCNFFLHFFLSSINLQSKYTKLYTKKHKLSVFQNLFLFVCVRFQLDYVEWDYAYILQESVTKLKLISNFCSLILRVYLVSFNLFTPKKKWIVSKANLLIQRLWVLSLFFDVLRSQNEAVATSTKPAEC